MSLQTPQSVDDAAQQYDNAADAFYAFLRAPGADADELARLEHRLTVARQTFLQLVIVSRVVLC